MPDRVCSEATFCVPHPVARVWPILSKTDWLNRSIGLPPVVYQISPLPYGGSAVRARARMFGLPLEWNELPFEWVEGEYYHVRRLFEKGPLRELNGGMRFREISPEKTEVRVVSEFLPRTRLGVVLAKQFLAKKATRDMAKVIDHVKEHLRGGEPVALPKLPRGAVHEGSLQAGLARLKASGAEGRFLQKVENFLRESTDLQG